VFGSVRRVSYGCLCNLSWQDITCLRFTALLFLAISCYADDAVVIRDVRLFDGRRVVERTSVFVVNGVIRIVASRIPTPAAVQIIDGSGKTLLPGLIDAHTHVQWTPALKQALAFGITTELDMFSMPEMIATYHSLERAGRTLDLADAKFAGICAAAPAGHGTEYGIPVPTIRNPEEAQAFVDARLSEGSDYIKIIYTERGGRFPTISRETLAALVAAAHRRGRLAVVHIDDLVATRDAIEAGVDGLTHIFRGDAQDRALVELAKRRGAFVVPTWSIRLNSCGTDTGREIAADPLLSPYLSAMAMQNLKKPYPRRTPSPSCEGARKIIPQLRDAGVPILAGTDAPNTGLAHGASLHGEIALLVEAGLTPVEALVAATSAPADAFRLRDRGRIAPGKRADLLLVEGDPTTNIRDTRNIVAVWKQGRQFDRAAFRADLGKVDAFQVPIGSESGVVSNFEDMKISTRFGSSWRAFDDIQMKIVTGGANSSHGALAIIGDVPPNRAPYLWPGVVFFPAGGISHRMAADLSGWKRLSFWAKADGRKYRLILTTTAGQQVRTFIAGPTWQQNTFAFADFGYDGNGVVSVILAGPPEPGHFELNVDEISFH
jgi:imidazolonepropionase-like amidohydrolase